jgi:hypothetical protein
VVPLVFLFICYNLYLIFTSCCCSSLTFTMFIVHCLLLIAWYCSSPIVVYHLLFIAFWCLLLVVVHHMLLLVTNYSSSLTIVHHLLLLVVLRCCPFFKYQLSPTFVVVHCLFSLLATTHHLLWFLNCNLYFPFPPLGFVGGGTWNIQMPNSIVGLVSCFSQSFLFFF